MTEHKHPNYMGIFWILLSVTVLEVGYSLMKIPRPILIIGLVSLAGFKAILVALYFMHLKFEKWNLRMLAIIPIPLDLILLFAGMSESIW